MDNNAIKFGTLYTSILQEANKVSQEDAKELDKAQEKYRNDPSDINQKDLYDTMVKIAKNPS